MAPCSTRVRQAWLPLSLSLSLSPSPSLSLSPSLPLGRKEGAQGQRERGRERGAAVRRCSGASLSTPRDAEGYGGTRRDTEGCGGTRRDAAIVIGELNSFHSVGPYVNHCQLFAID